MQMTHPNRLSVKNVKEHPAKSGMMLLLLALTVWSAYSILPSLKRYLRITFM